MGGSARVTVGAKRPACAAQRGAETAALPACHAGVVKFAAMFHFRLDLSLVAVDRITSEVVRGTLQSRVKHRALSIRSVACSSLGRWRDHTASFRHARSAAAACKWLLARRARWPRRRSPASGQLCPSPRFAVVAWRTGSGAVGDGGELFRCDSAASSQSAARTACRLALHVRASSPVDSALPAAAPLIASPLASPASVAPTINTLRVPL
jgi:hypothetical protein